MAHDLHGLDVLFLYVAHGLHVYFPYAVHASFLQIGDNVAVHDVDVPPLHDDHDLISRQHVVLDLPNDHDAACFQQAYAHFLHEIYGNFLIFSFHNYVFVAR
jgi:hypothetical protein